MDEKKQVFNSNIDNGFKIDYPDAYIPWDIKEEVLKKLLGNKLRYITNGYYTITCKSLGGLEHELGFHFRPSDNGVLKELEFFRKNYNNLKDSFKEFQEYFEKIFGTPTTVTYETEDYPRYQWQLGDVKIFHYIFDRFGPEEHIRIIKE